MCVVYLSIYIYLCIYLFIYLSNCLIIVQGRKQQEPEGTQIYRESFNVCPIQIHRIMEDPAIFPSTWGYQDPKKEASHHFLRRLYGFCKPNLHRGAQRMTQRGTREKDIHLITSI